MVSVLENVNVPRFIDEKTIKPNGSKSSFYLPLNASATEEKCIPEISHFQVINLQ